MLGPFQGVAGGADECLTKRHDPRQKLQDHGGQLLAVLGSQPPDKGAGQGVAYLDDGTMVVVEDAAGQVGEDLEVVVTSTTRTAVGRLLFARPA